MILLFHNDSTDDITRLQEKLLADNRVPIRQISLRDMICKNKLTLELHENQLSVCFQEEDANSPALNSEDIRVCFMPQPINVNPQWLQLTTKTDIDYAMQEWWATLLAFFGGNKHIQFVNPRLTTLDLYSEFEQILLYKKFNIQTADMILTNDAYEAIRYFNLWNQQALLKSVRSGYDTSKIMSIEDYTRINTLRHCPVIFHRSLYGQEVIVCAIGKTILTVTNSFQEGQQTLVKTELPVALQNKLLDIVEHINIPIIVFNLIYSPSQRDYFGYAINIYPFLQGLTALWGEEALDTLAEYLIDKALS